jgi:arylsulfatase A-like enzyme
VLDRGDTLAPDAATLAELLAAQGYQTAAFTNCYFLGPEFRIERGFARHDFAHDIESPRDAATTNEAVLAWVDALAPGPMFLFTHYFDVHSDWDQLPYDAPDEYKRRFAGDPPPGFRASGDGVTATRWLARQNKQGPDLRPEEIDHLRGLYDASIAYTDAQVGALLDGLDQRGRLRDAIVIVTADHGEEFLEHGRLLHTQVYEEAMRVPLLVSLPEQRGARGASCRPRPGFAPQPPGRTDALVQHVDLLPTLADCLGFPVPAAVQGRSFLAALGGGPSARDAVYFDTPRGSQRGILRDGWKLIVTPTSGRRRLFHLERDPAEKQDLAAREPARVAALAEELARHRTENEAGRVAGERIEVPDAVHEALEALGYLREDDPK